MDKRTSSSSLPTPLVSAVLGVVTAVVLFAFVVPEGGIERVWRALVPAHDAPSLPAAASENGKGNTTRSRKKSGEKGKVALRARQAPGTDGNTGEPAAGEAVSPNPAGLDALSPEDVAGGAGQAFFVTGEKLGAFFGEAQAAVFPSGRPAPTGTWGVRASLRRTDAASTAQGTPKVDPPVVITRGQFLDVVTRKMPSSLPTGKARDGVVFHSVAETEISAKVLSAALEEHDLAHDSLCNPRRRFDTSQFARVTLVFHATRANLDCVKVFLSREVAASSEAARTSAVREVTLVALSAVDGFYGARSEGGVTLTLQTWESAWLDSMVAAWDDDAALPSPARRAKRLAQTARALGRASDVVVDVPFLKSTATPFGNFVALPRALATGTVRARRIGEAVHKSKGKEAAWTFTPDTSLLIVSGVGKGLKFEAVDRR